MNRYLFHDGTEHHLISLPIERHRKAALSLHFSRDRAAILYTMLQIEVFVSMTDDFFM